MQTRLPALTGLRGIAVLLVVLAHAHAPRMRVGLFGVDVFFVLSGFLITGVLLRLAADTSEPRRRQLAFFLGRRAARLLPSLAVALIALGGWALLTGVDGGGQCLALASTHLMDLPIGRSGTCSGPFHITWSLAAEEQFYLIWPVLVLRLARVAARRASVVCLASYAVCWLAAEAVAHLSDSAAGWWNYFPAGRPSALLVGAALAFSLPVLPRLPSGAGVPLFVAGLVLTAALLDSQHQVVLGPLVALPAAVLIAVLVLDPNSPSSLLCQRPVLIWLGEISYCLYLVHDLLLHVLRDHRGDDSLLTNGLGVAAALVAAVLLHRCVEQPLRRRGYAWLASREQVTSGKASAAA